MNPYAIPGITRKKETETERIKRKVSEYYHSNLKEDVWARQVAMWVMRYRVKMSYEKIAAEFGSKHDSARHACKKVKDGMKIYEDRSREVKEILQKIYP